jgi:ribosome-binding protein aMBF1 (putative translation factor)
MKSYSRVRKELLRNKRIKKTYDELGPEFELIQMIIEKRTNRGLTQAQLAKKVGTKQSAISRLEGGASNPSLVFLLKLAKALGVELRVSLRNL